MKRDLTLLCVILFVGNFYGQRAEPKMKPLFDGKNLKNWKIPEGNIWWTIEDGALWAKSDPAKIGSILWTKKEYSNFVIEMDFKFGTGTVDSGIFMRGGEDENAQIQIGISGSLKRDMTGSPYVAGKGYPVEAQGVKELLKPNDWNTIKAMAIGNTYKVWLNGMEVMNYTYENAKLKGPIGLQLHPGKDMTIQFKNIKVADL